MYTTPLPLTDLLISVGASLLVFFARHHHALIQRFGRFPHRNAILGRASTAEELAYLASPEAFHG